MRKQTIITLITILFFLALLLDIYAIVTKNSDVEMIFKPLIATLLAVLYLVSVKKPNFWYLSALFFCFWGDVLLIFDNYFIAGLVSFLVGHLLYIKFVSIYLKGSKSTGVKYLKNASPFILFFLGVIYLIKDNVGELLVPVLIYGTVISAFGTVTLVNYKYKSTQSNLLLFLGAIIFIASDSLLAINKFYLPNLFYRISVMLTYGVAQYLLCRGSILKSSQKQTM